MKSNSCIYCNKKDSNKTYSLFFPKKLICEECSKIEWTLNKRLKRNVPTFANLLDLQKHLTTLLKRKTLYKHKLKPFSCPICGKKVKAIDAVNSQFIEGIIVCKDCNGLELDLKALIIKTKKGDDKLLNESIGSLLKAHYVS